tara:strand:- start:214 stop:1365 length:1152 start_codon:yes stop_codon:yes gene_type:complete
MTEMNNITISNLYQHPGERLLRWMSVKGEGSISDFKAAIENISNELGIEKWLEVKFFSYERLLNTYINLLHIERERTKWNIAKSSINILPGINNKAVLTGSRNEVLINNLLENSLKEEESYSIYLIESGLENVLKNGIDLSANNLRSLSEFYEIFTPHTVLFTDYDEVQDLKNVSNDLDISLNEISPLEYVSSLPTLDEYISMHNTSSIARFHQPEKFRNFINSSSFISYNQEINFDELDGYNKIEDCLYRYEIHGSQHQYYIYKDNKNYFITEEAIGFWKQISRLDKVYSFFIESESLSGILIIPTAFKLPKIYLKTLGFCLAVTPRTLKPARSDNRTNPKMDIYLNVPTKVAKTLIQEKLNCKLEFISEFSEIQNYIEING